MSSSGSGEPLATVAVVVDLHTTVAPGSIAVLLELLERAGVRSTWFVPADVDPALRDRLAFGGHVARDAGVAPEPARRRGDAQAWLRDAQVAAGRALERRGAWDLAIDASLVETRDGMSVVSEVLDLVEGLVRAGRLRVAPPGADPVGRG